MPISAANANVLEPLILRQSEAHKHSEEEKERQREIMKNAKNKWSQKVEQMIAETDEWFINEDGDIVLIYPQPENENDEERKEEVIKMDDVKNEKEEIEID